MTGGELDYLRSLVRVDIRKKERNLERFAPRPGQPTEEADAMRAKWERDLHFRKSVLAMLYALKQGGAA